MVYTIVSDKGGVAKTTTAIHLAAVLSESRPTLLIDADRNRSSLKYAARGTKNGTPLPFDVVPERLLSSVAEQYPARTSHLIIDMKGGPDREDLLDSVLASDVIIVPTEPDVSSMETLTELVRSIESVLKDHPAKCYGLLITNVPPAPQKDGELARAFLSENGFRVFKTAIRSYKAYKNAWARGTTVYDIRDDPRSVSAWSDCEAFANEILHAHPAQRQR